MFDAGDRHTEEHCSNFERAMDNTGSAAGPVPLPSISQPSLETTMVCFQLVLAANLAAYNYWREACRFNPVLAPFVR